MGALVRTILATRFTRKRQDLGLVNASKPKGFFLQQVCLFLELLLPLVFMLGAKVPSLVYGTALSISFLGAEYLQGVSVFFFFSGIPIAGAAYQAIWQLDRPRIEVLERHELVNGGPYSRIRHPVYMDAMLTVLGLFLLFLNLFVV